MNGECFLGGHRVCPKVVPTAFLASEELNLRKATQELFIRMLPSTILGKATVGLYREADVGEIGPARLSLDQYDNPAAAAKPR